MTYGFLSAGVYAQEARLATLRANGLAHDDLPDAKFFLACADQFVRIYKGQDSSDNMLKPSKLLLDMLRRNLASYKKTLSPGAWEEIRYSITTKPILVRASVVLPYESSPGWPLVSLQDSEDYKDYRLTVNAVPATDPALGSTTQLRRDLSLATGPQPMHVITHLLRTAKARNDQLKSQDAPPALDNHMQDDVHKAYAVIINTVSLNLCQLRFGSQTTGERRELGKMTKQLTEAPWVLVHSTQKFVAPCDLVFDIDEDLEHSELSS